MIMIKEKIRKHSENWKKNLILFWPSYFCLQARWSTECCLKHEQNRQNMVTAGALGILVTFLQGQKSNSKAIRTTSKAIRAYTLDDDMRQEYGKAHEHARLLVEEHGLIPICLEMIKSKLVSAFHCTELKFPNYINMYTYISIHLDFLHVFVYLFYHWTWSYQEFSLWINAWTSKL